MSKKTTLELDMKYHAANPERVGEPVATHSRHPNGLRVAPYDHNGMKGFCIVHAHTGEVFKYYYRTAFEAINRITNYYCKE
jgi:hypothetical protein